MKFNCFDLLLSISLIVGIGFANDLCGHEIFQDVLKEKYGLKSFSCKTCHQDADNRKLRTPFADLYYQEMKADNWSEKFAQAEAKGEAAVADFEQEVAEAFKKTLDNVGKKTLTVDDLFASGLLAGSRIDEKKRKTKEGNPKAPSSSTDGKSSSNPAPKIPSNPGPDSPKSAVFAGILSVADKRTFQN